MTAIPFPSRLPRDFWLYLSGQASTAIADAVLFVALPFVVLAAGGGQAALGSVVLAASFPRFLAPLLGTLADRLPGRALLALAALLRMLLLAGIALLALTGQASLPLLAAFAFLNGCLVTLSFTAGSALVPRLVTEAQRPQANSLSSAALMGLPLIGYGLGGLLIKLIGSAEALLCALPLYLLTVGVALLLRPIPTNPQARPHPFLTELRGGFLVLRAQPLLLVMVLLSFAMNLALNVVNVRAPLFMQRVGAGAGGYALFEGLTAGGALVGALAVGLLARRLSSDALINLGRALCVLALLGLAAPVLGLWFAASGLLGLSLGLLEVSAITRAQGLVAAGALGRVMGLFLGLNALGLSAGAGLGASALPSPALFVGLAALLGGLGLLWNRAVRRGPSA